MYESLGLVDSQRHFNQLSAMASLMVEGINTVSSHGSDVSNPQVHLVLLHVFHLEAGQTLHVLFLSYLVSFQFFLCFSWSFA